MLDDALKQEIQANYSEFLSNNQLQARYGQRLMIAEIARNLSKTTADSSVDEKISIIEAGTGTGKTLGYLIPSIPVAKKLNKKIILSTATIALQEQIVFKDLPEVLRSTSLEFSFTLAKGRRRYICLSLLKKFLTAKDDPNQSTLDLDFINNDSGFNNKIDLDLYRKFDQQLRSNKWNGERDDWDKIIDHASWFAVTSDHTSCSGKRCADYNACIFYKARENVFKSDIIVANHNLVMSDLAMGGGAILPPPAESIYIFDEGHHLPDKAIQHFSHNMQLLSSIDWLEQLQKSLKVIETELPSSIASAISKLPDMLLECKEYSRELVQLLDNNIEFVSKKNKKDTLLIYRFPNGVVDQAYHVPMLALKQILASFYKIIEQCKDFFSQKIDDDLSQAKEDSNAQQILQLLQSSLIRIESHLILLQRYSAEKTDLAKPPLAKWLVKVFHHENSAESGAGAEFDVNLFCSPVLPAQELQALVWQQCFAAIITSATIAVNGNFSLFQQYSGINGMCCCIPSHFDYFNQVNFYIPPLQFEPSQNSDEHTAEVADFLQQYIDRNKGSLVLFSSNKQLNDIEYILFKKDKQWQDLILTQSKSNKQEIIKEHKKRINKQQGSVIFGLASFAEGVDLPGEYCECVVICKLPFSVPDNPIDETLSEWMITQGRKHFFEVTVPQTTIKLIQACGRLIRKESDSGTIVLLDKRLMTKRYGQDIINALPNYRYFFGENIPL